MHFKTDILIIGGGLAGLTAALHLQKGGVPVILIEKNSFPHHKVCGEYISNEVLPYLQWLGISLDELGAVAIEKLWFTSPSGKSITTRLPLGGFGISRFSLDNYLYELFKSKGGTVWTDTVKTVSYQNDFEVSTQSGKTVSALQVIGAYGKRSGIDTQLNRPFIKQRSPFLAVKAHYSGALERDTVGLHNFRGGYCGVSGIEDGKINICYLADYHTFKRYKDINTYQQNVLYQNKHLKNIFERSKLLFETPITVSQLSFGTKEAVTDHILMIGDTAGLIHPLCGNGMGMAIHSAKICSELLIQYFSGTIKSKLLLEKLYTSAWNQQFKPRFTMGNLLSALLQKEKWTEIAINGLTFFPALLPLMIKKTHGKIIAVHE